VVTTSEPLLHGHLLDTVRGALRDHADSAVVLSSRLPDVESRLVVHVQDGWQPAELLRYERWRVGLGLTGLSVHWRPGKIVIGPAAQPGRPGCAACAETRRRAARPDIAELDRLMAEQATALSSPVTSLVTAATAAVVAELVVEEVERILADGESARLRQAVITLDLRTLAVRRHTFLPDPLCEICGRLPADTVQDAQIILQPRPKARTDIYRINDLAAAHAELLDQYVDGEVGLMRDLRHNATGLFPSTSGKLGLRVAYGHEIGFGRQLDYRSTELTAITEGLERYGGIRAGGRRTEVRGSYRDLKTDALDPRLLGLHAPEQYRLPGFPYQEYHPDLVFNWVWAYSFGRHRPILVPENYAYYEHLYHPPADRPFVYEISNGCALGGCLEEAILYGLLEVAERDAFLLTWYGRMSRRRVDLSSATDRRIPLMVERIERLTGYRVHAFDISAEQDIPAVWVAAVDEERRDGWPRFLCAGGAHIDPARALVTALLELTPFTVDYPLEYRAKTELIKAMLSDPYRVRHMEHHRLLYSAPEAFERLSFLFASPETMTVSEAWQRPEPHTDLTEDLRGCVERYLRSGLDVIVVDQTSPEHRVAGFSCVKVIVPGALPMTFGHYARRLQGLDRARTVPAALGFSPRPLEESQLNPHPHPFP
jgi:ribosomal protein S12 methylthiotransferase accessory factor